MKGTAVVLLVVLGACGGIDQRQPATDALGPAPAFDTSGLGTEVRLEGGTVSADDLRADPSDPVVGAPVVSARVDDALLVVYEARSGRTCRVTVGPGLPPPRCDARSTRLLVASVDRDDGDTLVTARNLPVETSVVAVRAGSSRAWARPRNRSAAFLLDRVEGPVRVTAYDDDGEVLARR